MKSGRQNKHGFHSYWRRCKRRMIHLKPKRLLISLIVVIFCVLAAMTPLGARTSMIIRFQIAELSADNSNDEYDMDLEHFYVRNQKTIHSLKQMLFRTSCERIPMQTVCASTLVSPSYCLITRRSQVQVLSPQPETPETAMVSGVSLFVVSRGKCCFLTLF